MATVNNEHLIRTTSPDVIKNEKKSALNNAGHEYVSVGELSSIVSSDVQGYYGLLSGFYFDGGVATETTIEVADVDVWQDVNLTIHPDGLFDNRPSSMKAAQPPGHAGDGATTPIVFSLEGLDTKAFANFRASMSFVPEIDEGQLESRLLFNRHSGTTPSTDFSIEEVSLSMEAGADIHYATEPMLSFFVGDTIDTNAINDAGQCTFQIKTNVPGVIHLRALTWYIQK